MLWAMHFLSARLKTNFLISLHYSVLLYSMLLFPSIVVYGCLNFESLCLSHLEWDFKICCFVQYWVSYQCIILHSIKWYL